MKKRNAETVRTVGPAPRAGRVDAASSPRRVKLGEVCHSWTSAIKQKDLVLGSGQHPIYGASGLIGYIDNFQVDSACIGVVKDGAGVGRVLRLPSNSSVIGTMMYIVPSTEIDNDYLYYALDSLQLGNLSRGATIPHVYFKDFKDKEIPLPPLPAQRAIAEELDRICELKRTAEKLVEKYQQLVKSRFVEMFGTDGATETPPSGECAVSSHHKYPEVQLSDVAEITGGLTKNSKRSSFPIKHRYLRVANVFFNRLDLDDIQEIGVLESEIEKTLLRKDDLLFVEGNGSIEQVGRVAIWNGAIDPCLHQNHLIKARFGDKIIPAYALFYFMSPAGRHQIEECAVSTTGLHTLSTGKVAKLKLPLPPIGEQRQFASFVAKVDKLEFAAKRAVEKLDLLYRSKLQEHFG